MPEAQIISIHLSNSCVCSCTYIRVLETDSGNDSDAGKTEGKREGWQRMRWLKQHHRFSGHKFEQNAGGSEGQGLACGSLCGRQGRTQLVAGHQQCMPV